MSRGATNLTDMHPDPDADEVVVDGFDDDEDAAQESEADENGHTISIRRSTGEEVLTVWSPSEEWSVYLEPGGGLTNAFVGTPREPIVWVDANGRQLERDRDGTYIIRID